MSPYPRKLFSALLLALLFPFIAISQYGPMGIGNKDGSPTFAGPQPRLLLWLDGSSARTGANSDQFGNNHIMTKWLDKSGNEHHFVQANYGTNQPTLRTSGEFSGPHGSFTNAPWRPSVNFRGTDPSPSVPLVCENFEMPADGFTIYFVIKSNDDHYALFNYATPDNDHEVLVYNNDGFKLKMGNLEQALTGIGDINTNDWNYGGIVWGNSGTGNWQYKNQNQSEGNGFTTFNGITITPGGKVIIGDIQGAPDSYPTEDNYRFDHADGVNEVVMNIAEIIVYEGRLPRPATRLMRTYFWLKYGIAGPNDAWDKFRGNMTSIDGKPWGGKYYAPIGVGRDHGTPNGGEVSEARSHGLVLRVREEWDQNQTYLIAGTHGDGAVQDFPNTSVPSNSVIIDDLSSLPDVESRWSRTWEISSTDAGSTGNQKYEVAFDFGEGIPSGKQPQNPENYVLLYRPETSGDFSIVPVAEDDKYVLDDEMVFRLPSSRFRSHPGYYTIGTKDNVFSSLTGSLKRTWYAYQTGNWSNSLTWTLDGSSTPAYVNPDGEIPASTDNVYIGAGRTVTVNENISVTEYDRLTVHGTLDMSTYSPISFVSISGSGLIRCAAGNFPSGNTDAFANPEFGGSVEYYGTASFTQYNELKVNNLSVNMDSPSATVRFAGNLTHNGLFEVKKGRAYINDPSNHETVLTIHSYGDVIVENNAVLGVAEANNTTPHNWYFHKDLINNGGTLKFTNRTPPGNYTYYTTDELKHHVFAFFVNDDENQEIRANGNSYFSRIVVDKGNDMTYNLSISSNGPNKFHLLGRCNRDMGSNQYYAAGSNMNSFALINGTAEIKENIFIPIHANGGNYNINYTAQLWVNGGHVEKSKLGGTNNGSALVVYGKVRVSQGILRSFATSGITIRANGVVQVDDGLVETNQIRTSNLGPENIGGLIINNGVVNINGARAESAHQDYSTLSLTYPGNIFRMTGGELNVTGATNSGLIFINSDPQNTNVSGGEVHLDVSTNNKVYRIASRAAFWNLTLTRSISSGDNKFIVTEITSGDDSENQRTLPTLDLIVRNNFTITGPNNPTLEMGNADAKADLYVHGNLVFGEDATYLANGNTTYFTGVSNSDLTFGGSTPFPFSNVVVKKDLDNRFVRIQQQSSNAAMDINGNFTLEKGYFAGRRDVLVRGNVNNSTQFGDDTYHTGQLRMVGTTGRQELRSDGGVVYRMAIDNPDGVALMNDGLTIKKRLTLNNGSLYIGNNKLRIESTESNPISSFDGSQKMVVCSGAASAGGIEILNHHPTQTLTYPFGVSTGDGLKYVLANVYVRSGWTGPGFISITPVDTLLSTANLDGTEDYLNFYWRVRASGYESRPKVNHRFKYHIDDIRGTGGVSTWVPGRVLSTMPFTRSKDDLPAGSSHIDASSKLIHYNDAEVANATNSGNGIPLVDADYTAGAADRFPEGTTPEIYYSRTTATGNNAATAWNVPGNWNKKSTCNECGDDPYQFHSTTKTASIDDYPGPGDIAVIGFDVNNSAHRPHFYKAPPEGIEVAQLVFTPLQDEDESGNSLPRFSGSAPGDLGILRPTLQLSNTTDIIKCGPISGEGAILLKDDVNLEVTDIGGFLAQDSSIVVLDYSSAVNNVVNYLPAEVPNLFIAKSTVTITNDIRVRGNLEVAGTSQLSLSEGEFGDIQVEGDLILNKFQASTGNPKIHYNGTGASRTIHVKGDLKLLGTKAHITIEGSGSIPPPPEPIPWTPASVSPELWLDATTGVVTDGSGVVSWTSITNGHVASQTENENKPVVGIFPGSDNVPSIQFDGTDDFLLIPHNEVFNLNLGQDFEIFSVSQCSNPMGNEDYYSSVIYSKGEVETHDFQLDNANRKYRLYINKGAYNIESPGNMGSGGTQPNFGWARREGNQGQLFNSKGGLNNKVTTSATMTTNTKDISLGAAAEGLHRHMNGHIGEIILVKRSLSSDERKRIEGYLAHKWGLAGDLPVGHPYKDERPYEGEIESVTYPQLIVEGSIIQNLTTSNPLDNGLELLDTTGDEDRFVNLVLTGEGNDAFINNSGPKPRFWKVTVDKGLNTNSGFSFNSAIDVAGPADEEEKPIEIRNGLLTFNHSDIDITLSSGGGDFYIPATGGLHLDAGHLRINGFETGMLLSGSLEINGGDVTIGDTEGMNNYIEYGAVGIPKIAITDGSLLVGSQIRRGLSSTEGSLDYRQSGGEVIIGRYAAPATNRAMLEVLNGGSSFHHTGGTLTFVRGVSQSTRPSLLLEPEDFQVGSGSEIFIGNEHSPTGAQIRNFGIQSEIPLNDLTIRSNNGPRAHLISHNLEIKGNLTIESGARISGGSREIIMHGDLNNDGTVVFDDDGVLRLIHPVSGTVSGSGSFVLFDLVREGDGGSTTVQQSLVVDNDFRHAVGEMEFAGNTLAVKGNAIINGNLRFDEGSHGLIFSGSDNQILTRSESAVGKTEIDIMTIDNLYGVTSPPDYYQFKVMDELRMRRGILSMSGNLFEMGLNAKFTPVTPFGENNMIVTGGNVSNSGLKLNIPAETTDDIVVPLGIERYLPVNFDFSKEGFSSGDSDCSYLIRLTEDIVGAIVDDDEDGLTDENGDPIPEINDLENVLGMFLSIDAENVGNGVQMDLKMNYHDQYVNYEAPFTEEDYIPARILVEGASTTVNKYSSDLIDISANIITFPINGPEIDGDYFAGVTYAIPELIQVYYTLDDGPVEYIQYDPPHPPGSAPSGSVVVIQNNVSFTSTGVNFYRTIIEEGSKITIQGNNLHRLGRVSGTGTIELRNMGILPSGNYAEFFGCEGGDLIYTVANGNSIEILSNMPPIKKVTLSSSNQTGGELIISNSAVNVCTDLVVSSTLSGVNFTVKASRSGLMTVDGDIIVSGGLLDLRQGETLVKGDLIIQNGTAPASGMVTAGNDGILTVEGNLEIGGRGINLGTSFRETHVKGNITKTTDPAAGSIQGGTDGAKLLLNNDLVAQTITGDFTGVHGIPTLELNNTHGLDIVGGLDISENLILTDGLIRTDVDNMLKLTADNTQITPVGGKTTAYVDGPMEWVLSNTATSRIFPVGKSKDNRFRPLTISDRSHARTWLVEYVDTSARTVPAVDEMIGNPSLMPPVETISIQEYWRVETNTGTTNARIGLSWGNNSGISETPEDQDKIVLVAYNEAEDWWDSFGMQPGSRYYDASTNRGSFRSADLVNFTTRYITLGSTDGMVNPLPVGWLYFKGENRGPDHLLTWATATETNNDYFELERSIDGRSWEFVTRVTGAGHSTSERRYSYTDYGAPFGTVYYRLRQVDFNGSSNFAPHIVSLYKELPEGTFDMVLYPNPTRLGRFNFRMSQIADAVVEVSISDLSGARLMHKYVQVDGAGVSSPVDIQLKPGIYLVSVIADAKLISKPLVVTE